MPKRLKRTDPNYQPDIDYEKGYRAYLEQFEKNVARAHRQGATVDERPFSFRVFKSELLSQRNRDKDDGIKFQGVSKYGRDIANDAMFNFAYGPTVQRRKAMVKYQKEHPELNITIPTIAQMQMSDPQNKGYTEEFSIIISDEYDRLKREYGYNRKGISRAEQVEIGKKIHEELVNEFFSEFKGRKGLSRAQRAKVAEGLDVDTSKEYRGANYL